jgi:hypothetical protein
MRCFRWEHRSIHPSRNCPCESILKNKIETVLYWTDVPTDLLNLHSTTSAVTRRTPARTNPSAAAAPRERSSAPAARERAAIVGGHQDRTSVARTSGLSAEARESERGSSPDAKAEGVPVSLGFTRRVQPLRARLVNGAASSLAAVPRTDIADSRRSSLASLRRSPCTARRSRIGNCRDNPISFPVDRTDPECRTSRPDGRVRRASAEDSGTATRTAMESPANRTWRMTSTQLAPGASCTRTRIYPLPGGHHQSVAA